jgi:hypothetical protein
LRRFGLCLVALALAGVSPAFADLLNFEGFPDGTAITTQYPGVTFSHATVLTAGVSLNEFEFPPHSGSNVVFDDGGPMLISFGAPVTAVSGYFTYGELLTLTAFDALNNPVGSVSSAFFNNEALSGDLGSSPNEFLQLTFAGGISSVTFAADSAGGSFTLDDLTVSAVPEPASLVLLLTVLAGVATTHYRRIQSRLKHSAYDRP